MKFLSVAVSYASLLCHYGRPPALLSADRPVFMFFADVCLFRLPFSPRNLKGRITGPHQTLPACSMVTYTYEMYARNFESLPQKVSARIRASCNYPT